MANKTKILLIEDDTFLAGMYISKLGFENFEILLANDGKQGIKLAEKEKPDLILLDILLPKVDGFEVLKVVKKNDKTKEIPVILLTNLGQKSDVEKGLSLGANDYLIKAHFMPQEVIKKIKDTLKIK